MPFILVAMIVAGLASLAIKNKDPYAGMYGSLETVHAQQTYTTTYHIGIYSAQTTAAPSGGLKQGGGFFTFIQDVGQCTHFLKYSGTNTTGLTIELEATNDPINGPWQQISNVGTSAVSGIITATGWYQFVRANLLTISGAGASVTADYYASTQCSGAFGGLTGGFTPSQPVTFVATTGTYGSAVNVSSPINFLTNPPVIFAGNVSNPNGSTSYVAIGPSVGLATFVQAIPANAVGQQLYFPVIGQQFNSGDHIFCTSSLSVPADPGSACVIGYSFKGGILVNGKVNVNGVQQGSRQPANPTQ